MSSARHTRKEQADYVKVLLELSHLTNTGNILRDKRSTKHTETKCLFRDGGFFTEL